MKLGISTASFFNKLPTEKAFDVLKSMGVGVTEIFLSTQSEYESDFVKMLCDRLSGIRVHSVHALGTQFEPELFSKNERVRTDAETVLKKFLRAVNILGAHFYTFHGPLKLKRWAGEADYEFMSARLKELDNIAKGFSVVLSYENVHYAYGAQPVFFQKMLSHYAELKTTLDIKQSVLSDNEPQSFLKVMGENLSTIHICDVTHDFKTALIGKGSFDFDGFFKACSKQKVKAPVLIENYCNDYKDFDELYTSFLYVKNLMLRNNVYQN